MSRKSIRIISTLLTIAIIAMAFAVPAFAASVGGLNIDDSKTNTSGADKVQGIGESILGIIRVVGTIIAVGVIMVLGIKYMMGSAEEKASYKKTMVPYIIGAILIFAAANLADYVYQFATGAAS